MKIPRAIINFTLGSVSLHYLLKHMAHLVQAVVWTAGLDDRLADSGLIPF